VDVSHAKWAVSLVVWWRAGSDSNQCCRNPWCKVCEMGVMKEQSWQHCLTSLHKYWVKLVQGTMKIF